MRLNTPSFWYDTHSASAKTKAAALSGLSALYGLGHGIHQGLSKPRSAGIPVICIGNLVTGGSGKTPTAMAVMNLIRSAGLASNPCFLSRGYGGTLPGPLRVDPADHTAVQVGDEPLLLAAIAPTIICANRFDGAVFARKHGHDLIVMDDGMQNTTLKKDLSIVVIDGASGFGNGLLLPAGPLRTPLHIGMKTADAVLLIGDDLHNALNSVPNGIPMLNAVITPTPPCNPAQAYHAFCGIARPEKFRSTLLQCGLNITDFTAFPDHYPYTAKDIETLRQTGVRLITTTKDAARLPVGFIGRDHFDTMDITLNLTQDSVDTLTPMIKAIQRHE